MIREPKWVSIHEAAPIAGRKSGPAMADFVRRWNIGHPDHQIKKMHGMVDEHTLRAALLIKSRQETPGADLRRELDRRAGKSRLPMRAR